MIDVETIKSKSGLFGAIVRGSLAVPMNYRIEKDSIAEWLYFQVLNLSEPKSRKFLKDKYTKEELFEVAEKYNLDIREFEKLLQ